MDHRPCVSGVWSWMSWLITKCFVIICGSNASYVASTTRRRRKCLMLLLLVAMLSCFRVDAVATTPAATATLATDVDQAGFVDITAIPHPVTVKGLNIRSTTSAPTNAPVFFSIPTAAPNKIISQFDPTAMPTAIPTSAVPSVPPTLIPTTFPTTGSPSVIPSPIPSGRPTAGFGIPTAKPNTVIGQFSPTPGPSVPPTVMPTALHQTSSLLRRILQFDRLLRRLFLSSPQRSRREYRRGHRPRPLQANHQSYPLLYLHTHQDRLHQFPVFNQLILLARHRAPLLPVCRPLFLH
jgi:hypothetical protein